MKTTIKSKRLLKSDIGEAIHGVVSCQQEVVKIDGADPILAQLGQALIYLQSAQEMISELGAGSAQDTQYRRGYL